MGNIYNIRSSCSFWDALAKIYLEKYIDKEMELVNVLFLVPNRRASRSLLDAFLRIKGRKPTILPKVIPILEIDDDELFFNEFSLNDFNEFNKKAIENEERIFLFTRMIMSKPNNFGLEQISLSQALNLAIDLAKMMDIAYNKGLSFDKLKDLVPEKYATHWQETLKLLNIITDFWPEILNERNAIDMCEMKKRMLMRQAEVWKKEQSKKNIIIAGVTANFPAIIELMSVVKKLENGEIYFAGIDRFANDEYWDAIDEENPHFELKELLLHLNVSREDILDLYEPTNKEREHLISEIMRPAKVTDKWLKIKDSIDIKKAIDRIAVINSKSQRDEALAIALKIREVLFQKEKTIALVTYDRTLARRVAVELERFDIKVDDSAGIPLNLSPLGIFLLLIVELANKIESNVTLIDLLKNPYSSFNMCKSIFRKKVYDYEFSLRNHEQISDENISFITNIKNIMNELVNGIKNEEIDFVELLKIHIKTAEIIASSDEIDGKNILWRGDEGKTAVKFISKLINTGSTLGKIRGCDYLSLFHELMKMETTRTNYGTHPRISILGPIEARLHHFDYIILGEMNEGIWPKQASADMWMSRPMKKDFGFNLPERDIGILATDLSIFMACKNVIITRADRVDGVPMKKSRWLLRLETVLKALGSSVDDIICEDFFEISNNADKPLEYKQIQSPQPTPPLYARPKSLSASGVDLLIHDPYSVFAKYILKLYNLDDLDIPLDQRDYGTLIHSIIEEFNNLYPRDIPDDALDILINLGKKHFNEKQIDNELKAFWFPKFINIANWIVNKEKEYRKNVNFIKNEVNGEVIYKVNNDNFTFKAKADRIDELKDGSLNIIDYKTGKIPSKKQVMSGHAVQLLLEALIAKNGNFEGISNKNLNDLIYWQLGSEELKFSSNEDDILDKCEDFLLKLVSIFNFESTPYCSRPTPKYLPKNRDYEHLARIKEWSVIDEGENND